MAKITRLSAEQRENLVAYVDGELDEPGVQNVEQALSESVVARHEVDMLSRTWDLLNVLPGVKVSEEFSRRTLSNIQATDGGKAPLYDPALAKNVRRGLVLSACAAMLVACGVLGYQATRRWIPDENAPLIEDFEVVKNLDEYIEVGEVEFLKILKTNRTLAEHNESGSR